MEISGAPALVEVYRDHYVLQLQIFAAHWTRLPKYAEMHETHLAGATHRFIPDAIASRDPQTADCALRASFRRAVRRHLEIAERLKPEGTEA